MPVNVSASVKVKAARNVGSDQCNDGGDSLASSLRRATRPPDLDLSPGSHDVVANCKSELNQKVKAMENNKQFDPAQSSTPTKLSDSVVSEGISLVSKNNICKFVVCN